MFASVARTTHLVIAVIAALRSADTQHGRRSGAHGLYSLETWIGYFRDCQARTLIFVTRIGGVGAPCKWDSDRHFRVVRSKGRIDRYLSVFVKLEVGGITLEDTPR